MNITDYNRCVDDHADGLYRFLLKNIKDKELARDLVQESFMKLWEKRKEVEHKKSKSYLFTTGYHTMIDFIRKNNRIVSYDTVEYSEESHNKGYSDLKEILNEAVEKLPVDQKSVVLLRDYEGYSYKEIAKITNLTESQVKVYIYRARLFLKKYIGSPDMVV
ncbi:MAG: RNA polymerase sigma factor [Bacteroidetes bacterium]|nr:MAG: RNA polymerase sigma factor [Bacteroidota bacterium]